MGEAFSAASFLIAGKSADVAKAGARVKVVANAADTLVRPVCERVAALGDVNGDGKITPSYARLILQFYTGEIDSFPAE